jgi:hypothetical protein
MKAKYPPWSYYPKYDYYPDEDFVIRLAWTHYKYKGRKSWSDTETQRLDDLLGHAILLVCTMLALSSFWPDAVGRFVSDRSSCS